MSTAEVSSPVVETRQGAVLGRKKNGVLMFNGIPYAAPPVGDRRFKATAPPGSWGDIRDCTRFGPAAPQLPTGGMTNQVPVKWDEDCLFLNVCTPAVDRGKRPVLVWIHGGAYRHGQGAVPWYNGASFALKGNLVVVSINYRLGALGFTDLSRFGEDFATSGVNGILDQIQALRWVRENIAEFGGDPGQVTIAGESVGGFSVCTLVACEQAQGLFQRAVSQSGSGRQALAPEVGARVADLLLEELGADSQEAVMAASALEILEAMERADARYNKLGMGDGVQAFYPVMGNQVLPVAPVEAAEKGIGRDIVMLAGVNKDENTLFTQPGVTENRLRAQAVSCGSASHDGERLLAAYRGMLPGASDTEISVQLGTDFTFKIPTIRFIEARMRSGAETWMYQFDWESRQPFLKATHALEIPFVFNTLTAPGVDLFIGEGELPQGVADEMHDVWTAFIRGETPGWPMYDSSRRPVWHFDDTSGLVENGDQARLAAWQGIR